MKTRKFWLKSLTLICAVFLLSGCNLPITPTPPVETPVEVPPLETSTPEPTLSASQCLVGTWEVDQIDALLQKMIPSDMIDQGQLIFKNTSGKILYTFDEQGNTAISSLDFKINADVQASIFRLPLVADLTGTGSAGYSVADNGDGSSGSLTFSDLNSDNMLISAKVSGVPVMNPTSIDDALWFSTNGETLPIPFTCQGSSMLLTPPDSEIPPVAFKRVS